MQKYDYVTNDKLCKNDNVRGSLRQLILLEYFVWFEY